MRAAIVVRMAAPYLEVYTRCLVDWMIRRATLQKSGFLLVVPEVGFEPTRCCQRGILNPLRLPFRHSGPLQRLAGRCLCRSPMLRSIQTFRYSADFDTGNLIKTEFSHRFVPQSSRSLV